MLNHRSNLKYCIATEIEDFCYHKCLYYLRLYESNMIPTETHSRRRASDVTSTAIILLFCGKHRGPSEAHREPHPRTSQLRAT